MFEKLNNKFDKIADKFILVSKEIISFPFFCIFICGTAIQILGWMGVEMITGEKIKEIKIIKES